MTTIDRRHRTALFVDGPALKASSEYLERVRRLEQSVNGPNVKVDIFTVFPEVTTNKGIVKGIATTSVTTSENYFDNDRLRAVGAEAGYVNTLIANPTRL